jgi:hypothetical protein
MYAGGDCTIEVSGIDIRVGNTTVISYDVTGSRIQRASPVPVSDFINLSLPAGQRIDTIGLVLERPDSPVVRHDDDGTMFLRIAPEFWSLTLANGGRSEADNLISIVYTYKMTVAGETSIEPKQETLFVTPVLFKVMGIRIQEFGSGRSFSFTSTDNTPTRLVADISSNPQYDEYDFQDIRNHAIEHFRRSMNFGEFSERVRWSSGLHHWNRPGNLDSVTQSYGAGSTNLNYVLRMSGTSKSIRSVGTAAGSHPLTVEMRYAYTSAGVPYPVATNSNQHSEFVQRVTYNIITTAKLPPEIPQPIYTADCLRAMRRGGHYILMNNLWLDSWVPMPFMAASLDGNNKAIQINSFNLTSRPQYVGLFSTVGINTSLTGNPVMSNPTPMIKNLNLVIDGTLTADISHYRIPSGVNAIGSEVRVGALAGLNAGIITNCTIVSGSVTMVGTGEIVVPADVGAPVRLHANSRVRRGVVSGQFVNDEIPEEGNMHDGNMVVDYDNPDFNKTTDRARAQLRLVMDANERTETLHVRFGGLVGENRGMTTNSRVMVGLEAGGSSMLNRFNAHSISVGGFVGVNSGTITSSFFRDAHIINNITHNTNSNLTTPGINRTAGFVAENSGKIMGCYAMGLSTELHDTGYHSMFGRIESRGMVGGFVYNNFGQQGTTMVGGEITDCFTSVKIWRASAAGGFVVSNSFTTGSGTSAVTRFGHIGSSFANMANNHSAFAADDIQAAGDFFGFLFARTGEQSTGIENSFVRIAGSGIEANQDTFGNSMTRSLADFRDISRYQGFSISADREGDNHNTWRMTTSQGPRLVAADQIAISLRKITGTEFVWDSGLQTTVNRFVYGCMDGYSSGSAINPVTIISGEQLNRIIFDRIYGDESIIDIEDYIFANQHLRLVDNISMDVARTGQVTSELHTFKTTFREGMIDGNGLSIQNIFIAPAVSGARYGSMDSVGLFSRVEYSTIKNVSLQFVNPAGASVPRSIDAGNSTFVGGLAGVSVNSNLIDINLINAASSQLDVSLNATLIFGEGIVGGLVGAAIMFNTIDDDNRYRIENIRSNVSVGSRLAGFPNQNVMSQTFSDAEEYIQNIISGSADFDGDESTVGLSIAGGIIGLVTRGGRLSCSTASGLMIDRQGMPINPNTIIQTLVNEPYNSSRIYQRGDVIVVGGLHYVCIIDNVSGVAPGDVSGVWRSVSPMMPAVSDIGNYVPQTGLRHNIKVVGDIAGGLVGFIDRGIVVDNAVHEVLAVPTPAEGLTDDERGAARSAITSRMQSGYTPITIFANYYAGGIVGANLGTISNSRISAQAIGNPRATEPQYQLAEIFFRPARTGDPGRQGWVVIGGNSPYGLIGGGVTGFNGGTVSDTKAWVDIASRWYSVPASNSAAPTVFNDIHLLSAGGIVGENKSGIVRNNTINGRVAGSFVVGGLIGKNFGDGSEVRGNRVNTNVGRSVDNIRYFVNDSGTPFEFGLEGGQRYTFSNLEQRIGQIHYSGNVVGFNSDRRWDNANSVWIFENNVINNWGNIVANGNHFGTFHI